VGSLTSTFEVKVRSLQRAALRLGWQVLSIDVPDGFILQRLEDGRRIQMQRCGPHFFIDVFERVERVEKTGRKGDSQRSTVIELRFIGSINSSTGTRAMSGAETFRRVFEYVSDNRSLPAGKDVKEIGRLSSLTTRK